MPYGSPTEDSREGPEHHMYALLEDSREGLERIWMPLEDSEEGLEHHMYAPRDLTGPKRHMDALDNSRDQSATY